MPHQTDVVERQANSVTPLTLEQRNMLSALYDRGQANDVGRAFAQACAGEKPTDRVAVQCLAGMGLVDRKTGTPTNLGAHLSAHLF